MDEQHEELAALNALHALDDSEQSALEIEMARDSELSGLAFELDTVAATLAAAAPAVKPPANVKAALVAQVRARKATQKKESRKAAQPPRFYQGLTWGIAAVLAAGCFWLWTERSHLAMQVQAMSEVEEEARRKLIEVRDERDAAEAKNQSAAQQLARLQTELESARQSGQVAQEQLATLSEEIAQLRRKDAFAQMQIATLQSTVAAYKEGVAVVVWDSDKMQGVLKLEKMPPVETGKDYQLWVVDPKNPEPVPAGIVRVDAQGFASVDFKPAEVVSSAGKFALSIEREGGVPKNEGPIILIGP
ncbi:anti-sigma factor [Prosthecobacter sp. SYSU 5D2]|uniref:anti-sigma factor domain-containing protein n=1 Tax=Prosthecobacter sp. SYSU 5D2 TaxID=3134134 RepID=UPI0031FF2E89